MKKMVKATPAICSRCKYHMGVRSSPGRKQTNNNVCCNYFELTGYSRIYENGKLAYDPKYCDKYEKGPSLNEAYRKNKFNPRSMCNKNEEEDI